MQDNKYIEGLLRGDDKMLRAIYKNFSGRISNYVIKNGGSKEDAKDIFQDALMIILQKAQSPDFELTSSFYTYLYSVCKLVFYGKRRKKTNQTVTIPEDNTLKDTYSIEQELINRELDKVYRDNFSKLGLLCQQLLKLFFNKKKHDRNSATT